MRNVTLPIPPWQALAHTLDGAPDLDDLDWALLGDDPEFALRCDQHPPRPNWRYLGFLAGRGYGKSFAIAAHITREIVNGQARSIALMAQDELRTITLQVNPLLEAAPLWCRAEMYKDQIHWANGAVASIYTPESPGKIRGFNGDFAWCSEFVAWPAITRKEAFSNLLTATRVGNARMVWDTTSKGRNELIKYLKQLNERNPDAYPIIRDTIFDNPFLKREYLQEQLALYSGRRAQEELEGKDFDESEGSDWQQSWIDLSRVHTCHGLELSVIGLDPGISIKEGVDGTGFVVVGRAPRDAGFYVVRDRSGVLSSEQWAGLALEEYQAGHGIGLTGIIVETNRGGDTLTAVIRATAYHRGIEVRVLTKGAEFPRRTDGVLYVKEMHSRGDKASRGVGPAALYSQGRVHHVGVFPELENEQCTYVPEPGMPSPNRFDACNMALSELAGLNTDKSVPGVREARAKQEQQFHQQLRARLQQMSKRSVI